jgi:hypothetical protein
MQRGGIFNPPGRMAQQGFVQAAAAGIIKDSLITASALRRAGGPADGI